MNFADVPAQEKDQFWRALFYATSIAVIGANDIFDSWGNNSMRAAISLLQKGQDKRVYAINPNVPEVLGLPTYPSILDTPGTVDLAVVVVPARVVPETLRQCISKGVKAAVIISAGFAEVDAEGAAAQETLLAIAREGGLHFVGPNCPGHANLHSHSSSSPVGERIKPGCVALISQSGTVGGSISFLAATKGLGLSKSVGTGNEADVHLEDYLEYLGHDDDTRIIAAYIEGLREGRRFFELARTITSKKPIIVLKAGATQRSSQAAKSHTGAIAGSDAVYSAAFRQAGVIRADDQEELCDMALTLQDQPLPLGKRVGMLTMGGGYGVLAAEACEREGLEMATLETQTVEKLSAILPSRWSKGNPIDLVGMKPQGEDHTISNCLTLLIQDKTVDSVISFLPAFPVPSTAEGRQDDAPTNANGWRTLIDLAKQNGKPLLMIKRLKASEGLRSDQSAPGPLEYSTPLRAARALRQLTWYSEYLRRI